MRKAKETTMLMLMLAEWTSCAALNGVEVWVDWHCDDRTRRSPAMGSGGMVQKRGV